MKEWRKPELYVLGAEFTESGYRGSRCDGVFIDISSITGRPGDQAILIRS